MNPQQFYENLYGVKTLPKGLKLGSSNNSFKFSPYFYQKANPNAQKNATKHYAEQGVKNGLIMHPDQILKWYPEAQITGECVVYGDVPYSIADFVQQFLYQIPLEWFLSRNVLVSQNVTEENFTACFMLHIGNADIGLEILEKIPKNNSYLIAISINNNIDTGNIVSYIKDNWSNYVIAKTPNLGNDISPTFMMYQRIKHLGFDHIVKLHTKSHQDWRNLLVDYLLDNLEEHLASKKSIVTNHNLFQPIVRYKFCLKQLKELGVSAHHHFVAGTMFTITRKKWDAVLKQAEPLIKPMMLTSFYYDNELLVDYSPVHTIERLFGHPQRLSNRDRYIYMMRLRRY
jgi:hypothetical protein